MYLSLITNLFIIIASQIVLYILPLTIENEFIIYLGFFFNVVITLMAIKNIEKIYYSKYKEFSSLLYMACPLVGVGGILYIIYLVTESDAIYFLMTYYIPLFICIYILNFTYILYKYIINGCNGYKK